MRTRQPPWIIITYDLDKIPLPALVAQIFGEQPLSRLGTHSELPRLTQVLDQSTQFHKTFYRTFESHIEPAYRDLISNIIHPIIGEPFCFQAVPTFRVHLPGNVAVGEFHRDADYHHPVGELNYWLPLTDAWASNTVWIQDDDDEFLPAEAQPGQIVHFDAVSRQHGNKPNLTGATRVSFDFRCIPMSKYQDSETRSVNAGLAVRIVYPGWHPDSYRPCVDEWTLLIDSPRYFPAHPAPPRPLDGTYDDTSPATAARHVALAHTYGIQVLNYFTYFSDGDFILVDPLDVTMKVVRQTQQAAVAMTWCARLPHDHFPVGPVPSLDNALVAPPSSPADPADRDFAEIPLTELRALLQRQCSKPREHAREVPHA